MAESSSGQVYRRVVLFVNEKGRHEFDGKSREQSLVSYIKAYMCAWLRYDISRPMPIVNDNWKHPLRHIDFTGTIEEMGVGKN